MGIEQGRIPSRAIAQHIFHQPNFVILLLDDVATHVNEIRVIRRFQQFDSHIHGELMMRYHVSKEFLLLWREFTLP